MAQIRSARCEDGAEDRRGSWIKDKRFGSVHRKKKTHCKIIVTELTG